MAGANFKAQSVKLSRIFNDKARNPRMASNYNTDPIADFEPSKHKAGLYEMIDIEGIKVPPAVSKLSPERKERLMATRGIDADFITVWGHRRLDVANKIHEKDPKRFTTIECLVYEGLSEADEIRMLMDHEGVKGLNEYELYNAIVSLKLNTNLSEEQIGVQVGRSRGYVQRRLWIASLPDVVSENFRRKFEKDAEGKPLTYVPITDKSLTVLNKAANADRVNTAEHPAIDPMEPGAEFRKAWDNLVREGQAGPDEPKSKTRKELLDNLQYVKDPLLRQVILWAAGDQVRLTDIMDAQAVMRAKAEGGKLPPPSEEPPATTTEETPAE